jgi:hypothetical protein
MGRLPARQAKVPTGEGAKSPDDNFYAQMAQKVYSTGNN